MNGEQVSDAEFAGSAQYTEIVINKQSPGRLEIVTAVHALPELVILLGTTGRRHEHDVRVRPTGESDEALVDLGRAHGSAHDDERAVLRPDFRHTRDDLLSARGFVVVRFNLTSSGMRPGDELVTDEEAFAKTTFGHDAEEIQTAEFGNGLEDLLQARGDRLVGVLNGVDYDTWSPERDRYIPHRFSANRMDGKRKNKRYVLEQLGLRDTDAPLIGLISRLTSQKGFDLCIPVLPELLATRDFRLLALGSGESRYEEFLWFLQQRFPDKVCFYRGYNEELAHLIEAGADLFLMPSSFEPCGISQMLAMRGGQPCVVHGVGGLRDTVEDGVTGFVFDGHSPDEQARGFVATTHRALQLRANDPIAWQDICRQAAAQRFDWASSAEQTIKTLYGEGTESKQ